MTKRRSVDESVGNRRCSCTQQPSSSSPPSDTNLPQNTTSHTPPPAYRLNTRIDPQSPSFPDLFIAILIFFGSLLSTTVRVLISVLADISTARGGNVVGTGLVAELASSSSSTHESAASATVSPNGEGQMPGCHPNEPIDCDKATRWYAVFVGKRVGVFNNW